MSELTEKIIDSSVKEVDDPLMEIHNFLNEGEEVISFVRYEGKFNRVKVVGQTNKRSFGYRAIFNRKLFVSSRRSISHIEFGKWRIPIWLWVVMGLTFIPPIYMIFTPKLATYAQGLFVLPSIVVVFSLIFRRFTYLGTAIGSQFFHIITRKEHLLADATSFIKVLHLQKYFNKPASESYVILNYFGKWIRRFIILVATLTLITWITLSIMTLPPMEGLI